MRWNLLPDQGSQLGLGGRKGFYNIDYLSVRNLMSQATSEDGLSAAAAAAAAKSLQSCLTLCDPRDGSPPGSPVPGILQARTLEWLPFPSPMHESEK